MRLVFWGLAFGVVFRTLHCTAPAPSLPSGAWYYWKTVFRTDSLPTDQNPNAPLYVRLFDVEVNPNTKMAFPWGRIQWRDTLPVETIAPVVFFTPATFRIITDTAAIQQLAAKVVAQMEACRTQARTSNGAPPVWREVQFDYDWTPATRSAYFYMLKCLRVAFPHLRISCTIRLHQYRERVRNGIPPVDRGALMCYNTGNVRVRTTPDAILDLAVLKGYLKAPPYPLPLDVALPRFTWGAWFRGDTFQGLLQGWSNDEVAKMDFLHPVGGNRYRARTDTVRDERYFRRGDEIRIDGASPEDLREAIALTRPIQAKGGQWIYFP